MDIVRISDGLGNQMFQYAFARKWNMLTGHRVYLDTRFINNEDLFARGRNPQFKDKLAHRKYGLSHFKIALPEAEGEMLSHCENLYKWFGRYKVEDENFYDAVFQNKVRLPAYYQGYFFDLRYYDDIRAILRREFSLKEKVRLPDQFQKILAEDNTVSVHIRRGDFLKLNRDISRSGYYERAFAYMEEKVASPFYLIFSDDTEWVKDNVGIPGNRIFVSEMGFADYEELTVMKHCKNNVIANSTFSYWAAYLNANPNKTVVCPKRWRTGTIPQEWIAM